MLLANFNGKEHLRHRAVSLRQHGFLVAHEIVIRYSHYCPQIQYNSPVAEQKQTLHETKFVLTSI